MCENLQVMAGAKSKFWDAVILSLAGFFLCLLVVIMTALLVDSIVYGYPDVSEEDAVANTAPVGQVYYRTQ